MVERFFLENTQCPRCQGELTSKSGQLNCAKCRVRFPEVDGVPWLFPYPDSALADWRHRAQFQLQTMINEIGQAEAAANEADTPAAKERLTSLATGLRGNLQILADLLKPLAAQSKTPLPLFEAVKSQLPLSLKLLGYHANLHRDWCWGESEHQATKAIIEKALGTGHVWGNTLVLGAGAGRLAYDIATWKAEVVVALDINPLLVAFGRRMTSGDSIKYHEIPIPPSGLKETSVLGECKAPQGAVGNLHWLLADGLNPPFQGETFDTVVTPWFIDVVPQDLNPLSDQINRVLKTGGVWVNFGPYGFLNSPLAKQYSRSEVLEIVSRHGFKITDEAVTPIPYLQSPHSAQRRTENVLCFAASKERPGKPVIPFRHYPEWMELTNQAVPKTERLGKYGFAAQVQSDVMTLIDGQRSIDDIAKLFADRHKVSADDAVGAVSTLLRQLWDGV